MSRLRGISDIFIILFYFINYYLFYQYIKLTYFSSSHAGLLPTTMADISTRWHPTDFWVWGFGGFGWWGLPEPKGLKMPNPEVGRVLASADLGHFCF